MTADGGRGGLRPVRSGRQRLLPPARLSRPFPLSPPAPLLPPLSTYCPPPSFSLYPPPPHALPPPVSRVAIILIGSLCLACRHVSGATRTLRCCPLRALLVATVPGYEEERTMPGFGPRVPNPKCPIPGPRERQLSSRRARGCSRGEGRSFGGGRFLSAATSGKSGGVKRGFRVHVCLFPSLLRVYLGSSEAEGKG